MNILEELATYISEETANLYTPDLSTGNIFINKFPETDLAIGIIDAAGIADDVGLEYVEKNIKIMVKGTTDPIESFSLINPIYTLLRGFEGLLTGTGHHVVSIIPRGEPNSIGQDKHDKFVYQFRLTIDYKL